MKRTHTALRAITLTAVALLVTSLLLFSGCDTKQAQETKTVKNDVKKGGTVVLLLEAEPSHLNSFIEGGQSSSTGQIANNIIPGLFTLRPDFSYKPYLLAEEPTRENGGITDSPFTVRYKLRKGLQWSDKKPITSSDIAFTWHAIMNKDNKIVSRSGYDQIESIQTADALSATVTFKQPYAGWKDLFSMGSGFGILPAHLLEGQNLNETMLTTIDFSGGPFIFEEWRTGSSLTLVRNDNYWGPKANLDKVVFKFVPDPGSQREQLRNEEATIIVPNPDVDLLEQLKEIPGVKTDAYSGTYWEQLAFNGARPPLGNVNLRKAIAYGIDRQAIVDGLLKGNAKTLQSVIVPNIKQYSSPSFEQYSRNTDKAISFIERAGYKKATDDAYYKGKKKLSLTLSTTSGDPGREKVEQLIVANLKEIGIPVKIVNAEPQSFFGRVMSADYDMGIWSWIQSPDPNLTPILASDAVPPAGQNVYGYRNADVTALLHESNSATDPDKRAELLTEAQAAIADDVPLLPLFQKLSMIAYSDRLHGPKVNATLAGQTWNMGEWWLEDDK